MTSEPTEPQGTDESSGETETSDEEQGDERVEARAAEPTRVDSDERGTDETEKSVVPAPSETSDDEDSSTTSEEDDEPTESDEAADAEADSGLDEETSEAAADADSEAEAGLDEETSEAESDEREEERRDATSEVYVDLTDQAVEWLDELFERMNYDAEAEIRVDGERPRVDIRGPDAGRLLGDGKLGPKAVEGIETLLQTVFSEDEAASDVYVDVGGRREARKEMLREVAVSMADKAVRLDDKMTVSGLNSTERRIIHRRLRDYDGVDTESVGEGIFRRLTITPEG